MERVTGLMLRFAKPNPPSQAQSGEFLKTLHWSVFLTEFHLIGSSPCSCSNGKRQCTRSVAAGFSMERVTGLEPANTSLGSSGLTTWRHPHQVTDYTLSARKGIERFGNTSYSALSVRGLFVSCSPICRSPRSADAFRKWSRCSPPVLPVIFCRQRKGAPTGAGKMQLINAFETSLPDTFRRRFR